MVQTTTTLQRKPFEAVAEIALWPSSENKKTDYNGKLNWYNQDGEVDRNNESLTNQVFLFKETGDDGKEFLSVSVCQRDAEDKLQKVMRGTLYPKAHSSSVPKSTVNNEKSPVVTGFIKDVSSSGGSVYEVALWKVTSDNPKAPRFSGKVNLDERTNPGSNDEELPF